MSDQLPDPAENFRAVNDEIARKTRWLRELRRRVDSDARPKQEAYDEAKQAAGIPNPDEQEHAA